MQVHPSESEHSAKPVLVLVAGNAHGGTTITNLIVGQHPQAFSAGTLKGFPDNGHFDNGHYCSCGELAIECSFWKTVRDEHASDPTDQALIESISQNSKCTHIIDVTHGIGRVADLVWLREIDVRLVFVQRRLLTLAGSHQRLRTRRGLPSIPLPALFQTLRLGYGWSVFPRLARDLAERSGVPYAIVEYETVATAPMVFLQLLQGVLGLDYRRLSTNELSTLRLRPSSHVLRGNGRLLTRVRESGSAGIRVEVDTSHLRRRKPLLALVVALGAMLGRLLPTSFLLWRLRRRSIRVDR